MQDELYSQTSDPPKMMKQNTEKQQVENKNEKSHCKEGVMS